jgi:hypothetical protein
MPTLAGSWALAACLALGAPGPGAAMTPEAKEQMLALTRDAKSMWETLPARASGARKTAGLIQDLEAFASLPEPPGTGIPDTARRNGAEALAWCKQLLAKQYRAETGNAGIPAFVAPAHAFPHLIPKTLHFIWLGSAIPDAYLANIRAIGALNSDYLVQVWADDASRSSADSLRESRFRTRHVDQALGLAATPEDARNIYRLAVSKSGCKPNYAAASDILRMVILYAEGGVYLDTDTRVADPKAACAFGQLKTKYGFLVSTRTLQRDGQFNNSPMAAVPGSPVLGELLALAGKRYRDAAHESQPSHGKGPDSQSWLHWVADGSRNDLRLSSTVFLSGPVLVADYLARLGQGWLNAKGIKLDEGVQAGPPAVELFTEASKRVSYHALSAVAPVEDYYFLDTIYGDFDLTSETYGLSHQFHNSWLLPKS